MISDVIAKENEYRKLFAQDPANSQIKDPYVSLVPIHADETVWRAWGQHEDPVCFNLFHVKGLDMLSHNLELIANNAVTGERPHATRSQTTRQTWHPDGSRQS